MRHNVVRKERQSGGRQGPLAAKRVGPRCKNNRAAAGVSGCNQKNCLTIKEVCGILIKPQEKGTISRSGAVRQLVGLITRRSQVQILPPQPYCASEKDNLPKNPVTTTVSGFFRALFLKCKKKIFSCVTPRWQGLELKLHRFSAQNSIPARVFSRKSKKYLLIFCVLEKWSVSKCDTDQNIVNIFLKADIHS